MDEFLSKSFSSGIPGHLFRSVDQAPCVSLCGFTPSRVELLLDAFLSLQVSVLNLLVLAILVTSMLQFTFNANTLNILTLQHCRGLVKRSLLFLSASRPRSCRSCRWKDSNTQNISSVGQLAFYRSFATNICIQTTPFFPSDFLC